MYIQQLLALMLRSGFPSVYTLLLALLAGGCTLTSSEVEPGLPGGQIDGQSTVAYYANRIPVVVNNTSELCLFCGGFDSPVWVERRFGRQLILHADDADNAPAGTVHHRLTLGISGFRGRGSYTPDSANTEYTEWQDGSNAAARQYRLVADNSNQFIVSHSDTTKAALRGTFSLTLLDPASGQTMRITDGRVDYGGN